MPTQAAELVFDRATKQHPGRPEPAVDRLSPAVPAKPTLQAMIAMNGAVAVDKASPAAVAAGFPKANGLGRR